jgi:hypothetical protein
MVASTYGKHAFLAGAFSRFVLASEQIDSRQNNDAALPNTDNRSQVSDGQIEADVQREVTHTMEITHTIEQTHAGEGTLVQGEDREQGNDYEIWDSGDQNVRPDLLQEVTATSDWTTEHVEFLFKKLGEKLCPEGQSGGTLRCKLSEMIQNSEIQILIQNSESESEFKC